jgi:hypothetical protein
MSRNTCISWVNPDLENHLMGKVTQKFDFLTSIILFAFQTNNMGLTHATIHEIICVVSNYNNLKPYLFLN